MAAVKSRPIFGRRGRYEVMSVLRQWIKQHKFLVQLATFLIISLPALGLYPAAVQNQAALQWGLLGLVLAGNVLALLSD
jgi:hypothetical protein